MPTTLLVVLTTMNFGAVPALQDLLHDAVPCAPTQKELKAFQNKFKANNDIEHSLHATAKEKLHGNQTFYLHDDGALNFDKEIACVAKHFHVSTNSTGARAHLNWDVGGSTLEIMYAEHLGEVAILRDLRNHPMRTMDPMSAKIHILGFPTLLTWLAQGGRGGGMVGRLLTWLAHTFGHGIRCLKSQTAIKKAGAEARKRYELYPHAVFLLVFTHWRTGILEEFASSFGRNNDRVFLGTSDPKFMAHSDNPMPIDPLHTIIVPYRSNYELDADLSQQTVQGRTRNKSLAFFFAGAFDRREEGHKRGPTMQAMQHADSLILNRAISGRALTETIAQETMLNFRRSAFCLAPTGDTATSRRVFEALAAGCVPVSMGHVKDVVAGLPFHHSVDWSKTMLFAGPMNCLAEGNGAQAKLLATFLVEHARNSPHLGLNKMRRIGVEGYLHNLDYQQLGIVDALLREVFARLRWKETSIYGGKLTKELWHGPWNMFKTH